MATLKQSHWWMGLMAAAWAVAVVVAVIVHEWLWVPLASITCLAYLVYLRRQYRHPGHPPDGERTHGEDRTIDE
jgi:hypothetical protein